MSNHGTLIGSPTFVAGKFGQALYVPDFSKYVSIPEPSAFDWQANNSYTVSAWVYPLDSGGYRLFAASANSDGSALNWAVGSSGGNWCFAVNGFLGGGFTQGSLAVAINQWHFVQLVLTAGTVASLYVDGNRVATSNGTFAPISGTIVNRIGQYPIAGTGWNGYIDEFHISATNESSGATDTVPTAAFAGNAPYQTALYHFDGDATDANTNNGSGNGGPPPVIVALIGDSITAGQGSSSNATSAAGVLQGLLTTAITANAVVVLNRGVSGMTTADWTPTSTTQGPAASNYYNLAKAAIQSSLTNSASKLVVSIMLGTNDCRIDRGISGSSYQTNQLAIANQLLADFASHTPVVIFQNPPYTIPGISVFSLQSVSLLQYAYPAALRAICNSAQIIQGERTAFGYFQANPTHLPDGVHPDDTGHAVLAQMWATPIVSAVLGNSIPMPVITSPATAAATVGTPFTFQIAATGSPVYYTATGLPSGLTCNELTGLISGTITALA